MAYSFSDPRIPKFLKHYAQRTEKTLHSPYPSVKQPYYSGYVVVPSESIDAAVGNAPGIGTANLYIWDEDQSKFIPYQIEETTQQTEIYNLGSAPLSTSKFYRVANEIITGRKIAIEIGTVPVASANGLYITGDRISNVTTRRYEESGSPPSIAWNYDAGVLTSFIGTYAGVDGAVLTLAGLGGIDRISSSGSSVWTSGSVPSTTVGATLGPSGVAYSTQSAGLPPNYVALRKWNDTGSLVWEKTIANVAATRLIGRPFVDSSGNIYHAHGEASIGQPAKVRSWDSDGNIRWDSTGLSTTLNFDVSDIQGSTVLAYKTSGETGNSLVALQTSNGAVIWSYASGTTLRYAKFLSGGDIVTLERQLTGTTGHYLRRYSESGGTLTQVWETLITTSTSTSPGVNRMAIDSSDGIYVGGQRLSNLTHHKYSSAGSLLWSADHGGLVFGLAF